MSALHARLEGAARGSTFMHALVGLASRLRRMHAFIESELSAPAPSAAPVNGEPGPEVYAVLGALALIRQAQRTIEQLAAESPAPPAREARAGGARATGPALRSLLR